MKFNQLILGISYTHNSSACLLNGEGEVIFASSEERFTKNKNDTGIPINVIKYIFDNFPKENIKNISVGDSCNLNCHSKDFLNFLHFNNNKKRNEIFKNKFLLLYIFLKEFFFRIIKRKIDAQKFLHEEISKYYHIENIFFFDHHKSHAASAYYTTSIENAYIFTMDGEGDFNSGSLWINKGKKIKKLDNISNKSSVGIFYRTITSFLNFKPNEQEGKITGLAAYGSHKKYLHNMKKLLSYEKEKNQIKSFTAKELFTKYSSSNNINFFNFLLFFLKFLSTKNWKIFYNQFLKIFSEKCFNHIKIKKNNHFNFKADISSACQFLTESVVIDYLKNNIELGESTNLLLAGGLFSNVSLNNKIFKKLNLKNIYICPAMGDEGLSLGAAYLSLVEKLNIDFTKKQFNPYLGTKNMNYKLDLKKFTKIQIKSKYDLADYTANILMKDENVVFGIYNGKYEFGPRSLGNRSIIASPKNNSINKVLNDRLNRSEFMPFAPITINEHINKFVIDPLKANKYKIPFRYMTITTELPEKTKKLAPGITHVDGTARPQLLDKESNPLLYQTIEIFYKLTGIPCLINTSFNIHEKPIISDPYEAFEALDESRIDYLIINDEIVKKIDNAL